MAYSRSWRLTKQIMQSLNDETYETLLKEAYARNMSVQRFIEGVIILEWLRAHPEERK